MPGITPPVTVNSSTGLGKWLVKVEVTPDVPALTSLYTDGVGQVDVVADVAWRRLTWRFQRATPTATTEDFAIIGFDVVAMSGTNLDQDWTEADYTTVDTAVDELWTNLRPMVHTSHTLAEVQYHLRAFHADFPAGSTVPQYQPTVPGEKQKEVPRFVRTGPPLHRLVKNQAGSNATAAVPFQSAISVTFKSAARKHWGRLYMPGVSGGQMATTPGRIDTTATTTIANAFAEFASDLAANGFFMMTPMTQQDSVYSSALGSIEAIQVDDIPDVIRRRRPRQAVTRTIGQPTP